MRQVAWQASNLDMQLGGSWVGDVKLDTLPVEMYIDYIRVFEKAP